MSDLIDRQTAQRLFGKAISFKEHVGKMMWSTSEVKEWVAEFIEDLPSASTDLSTFSDKLWKIAYERGKAERRKKGKWKEHDYDEDKYDVIKCPCCKHMFTVDSYHWTDIGFVKDDFKFCPNCGADMRDSFTIPTEIIESVIGYDD